MSILKQHYDVIIIGAGAAGLFCAFNAAQRGRRVLVLDRANKVGKKILMSGGGRCNFTHLYTRPDNFFSNNEHFCKSALKRYSPYDFLALTEKHHIESVEKEAGQLFCRHSAKDILNMLLDECAKNKVSVRTHCEINQLEKNSVFDLKTSLGHFSSETLVVATGGLSIPTLGGSGFGFDLARQFSLNVLPLRPALVPLTLQPNLLTKLSTLSGLSHDVSVSCNNNELDGPLLFTHRGLSGPVILQISSYWHNGDEININLLPKLQAETYFLENLKHHPDMNMKNILTQHMPKRMAELCCELWLESKAIKHYSMTQLKDFAAQLHNWIIKPAGSEGYRTAEVTMGGVDTDELSSKTMQAHKVEGLYFIGEVVDVTGQLGGYNFQWAWSSAWAAAQYV